MLPAFGMCLLLCVQGKQTTTEVSVDHEGSFSSLPFFSPHRLIFVINLLCEIWKLLLWNAEDFSRLYLPVKNGLCHQ